MTAQQLKNSILQLAVQGKLVPQDPNDEPASVLLERIKAEKQALIKEGKIKKEKKPSEIFRGSSRNLPYTYCEQTGKEIRDISDEIPFDIPESWEWCRLGTVFHLIMGQSPKGDKVFEGKNGIEFHQGKIYFGKRYIDISNQSTNKPTKIAPANSVLLCVRAPVGKVNITNREICIGRGLCAVVPLDEIGVDFTFFWLLTLENEFVKKATGTTFTAITGEIVNNQLIPLPPLAEQKRIVSKIEELIPYIEEYDKAETELSALNETFPEMLKKSILQEAVQGKLVPQDPNDEPASVLLERIKAEKQRLIKEGKIKRDKHEPPAMTSEKIPYTIPDSWVWCTLGTIFRHNTGKALNSSNHQGTKMKYITTSNLYWNRFELDKIKEMLFTESEVEKCTVNKGDLLVCEGGDIGRAAVWNYDYPMRIQNHIHRLRPYVPVEIYFFYYVFYLYKKAGLIGGKGIGIQGLSSNAIDKLLIPLPPVAEQKRIVAKIEELMKYCGKLK